MSNTYYAQIIRKLVIAFGNVFNDITLVRYNPDGSEQERFLVPIQYGDKEEYVQRLLGDPDLDKKVRITLPRMSFENTGMSYDASRKQLTNVKNFYQSGNTLLSQYNPVPYDFDFSLYIYVRNITDGTQIVEHILPFFAPDYTIKVNMIPEMNIVKEVPIVLKSATRQLVNEGSRDMETRLIIWTLDFTVKGYIFGAPSTTGPIKTANTRFLTGITSTDTVVFNMNSGNGNYKIGEMVYQGYTLPLATATGTVKNWANNTLTVTNVNGTFQTGTMIFGALSNAGHTLLSYNAAGARYANSLFVTSNVYPYTANSNSYWTANTIIRES